jgi:hypothetical protein
MSNYDTPGSLDGAIDDVVREMMQVDPRPGLRQRVAGSIGARRQRTDGFRLGLAWAASLAVVAIVSVLLFRSPEPSQPVHPPQVAVAPPAVPASPQAGPQAVEARRTAPARVTQRRDPAPESIFGPRADRVAAASVAPSVTATTAPADADAIVDLPSFPGALPRITPIGVAPIHVTPLAITPLSVSALSHRR